MNKPHHQNNISVMEDLVGGLVGMKDRRTKPLVENCVNSPILHPYRSIICKNLELGITRFVITCFAHTHTCTCCRQYTRDGGVSTEISSIWLDFFIISSNNDCGITIRILEGGDESE